MSCIPLTDAQRASWAAAQHSPGSLAAGNQSLVLRLRGNLDVPALRRAFAQLVARHDALRLSIAGAGDGQSRSSDVSAEISWIDLITCDPAVRADRARHEIEHGVNLGFDLAAGPLFRASLVRVDLAVHLLALVVHELAGDARSLPVIARELGELYSAAVLGRPANLPAAISFWTYAEHEAARRPAASEEAENFWQQQLAGERPEFALADHAGPPIPTHAGEYLERALTSTVPAGLDRLCAEQGCPASVVLFAAFTILLHRLSGQDDLVLGVSGLGDEVKQLDHAVGPFTKLLPVRCRFQDDTRFPEYLDAVRHSLAQVATHPFPPGAGIGSSDRRGLARTPAPTVIFNGVRDAVAPRFAGLTVENGPGAKRFVVPELSIHFERSDRTLVAGCHYSTERYDDATIGRWLGHLETLLCGMIESPRSTVADLPLLSPAERQQLLVEWNDTALPYDRAATVPELFRQQVQRNPNSVAIVGPDDRWTYRELDQRSDAIASLLRSRGVGFEVKVGVFLERTPLLVAAILGVLKTGAAYVPLDVAYPKERLMFIAGDTDMPVVLSQQSVQPRFPEGKWDVLTIDGVQPAPYGSVCAPSMPLPDALAYVIYTSGSTGRPKGVCVPHGCVAALVAWARQQYRPEEMGGVLYATSASFDVSVFESLVPLSLGGKIILAANILELPSLAAAGEVRLISGVPSAVMELVRNGLVPPSVCTVNLAGEACPQHLVDALYALPHIERVYDVYGPTETTVYSTGALRTRGGRPTIGRPLPNEQAYILDRRMQPVPVGVRGELYIGGDKVSRGYLNLPQLTDARFLTVPFPRGGRMYRTGDAARFRPDGSIEFLGRLDHQVKIRGHRIEPGEIESVLAQHPAIAECVVIARDDGNGRPRLLGYVVQKGSATLDGTDLRTHLLARLPEYMLPAAITVLKKLPRTLSGKIDRPALPEPDFNSARGVFVPPRSTAEELLADIWRDVLGLKQVGVHDSFFDLGGHSLLAVQVIVRLQDALNIELTVEQIFLAPTIAGLANVIELALLEQIDAGPAGNAGTGVGSN